MSDYPRPKIEEPKPYPPDRIVGWIGICAHAGNLVYWLYRLGRQGGLGYSFRSYPLYGYGTLAFTALLLGLFAFLRQSRRGAFMGLFWLLGLMLVGIVMMRFTTGRVSLYSLVNFPSWIYCVARLFGLLGPRLVRGRTI